MRFLIISCLALALTGCAPTEKQLTEILEKHPEIITNAIKKNPEIFVTTIQNAARSLQSKNRPQQQSQANQGLSPNLNGQLFMGLESAKVTIVEYTDFQCPFCGKGYATIEDIRKIYGDQVRVVIKNLPLDMHPLSMPAAKRFEALKIQSPEKAFKYYHYIFSDQRKLSGGETYLDSVAKDSGADMKKLKSDMNSVTISDRIKSDMDEAQSFGIQGTPGFVINGVAVKGAYPIDAFRQIIDKQLKK